MKNSEFRIGNIVQDSMGNPFEIFSVSEDMIVASDRKVGSTKTIHDDEIHPVVLSEKWMFHLKFKYQDRDVNRKDGKKERFYMISWFDDGDQYGLELQLALNNNFKRNFCWINWDIGGGKRFVHVPHKVIPLHVHQLQNLYNSLSGQEL